MSEMKVVRDARGRMWTQDEIRRVHEGFDPPIDIEPRAAFLGDEDACMICQMNELPPEEIHTEEGGTIGGPDNPICSSDCDNPEAPEMES